MLTPSQLSEHSPSRNTDWLVLHSNHSLSPLRKLVQDHFDQAQLSTKSPLGRLKQYWHWNPKKRLALWLWLLTGGMVATSSGAFGVAGILLWTRAAIAGIGGYITAGGICEILRNRKKSDELSELLRKAERAHSISDIEAELQHIEKQICSPTFVQDAKNKVTREQQITQIISCVSGLVSGVLASVSPLGEVQESISFSGYHVSKTLDMQEIIRDIRNRHPDQWWISLEQMIRRVDRIRNGIPLGDTQPFEKDSREFFQKIYSPDGPIAAILSQKGYPVEVLGVDGICRTLSEEDIISVVEAYSHDWESLTLSPGTIEAPSEEMIPPKITKTLSVSDWISWHTRLLGALGITAGLALLGTRIASSKEIQSSHNSDTQAPVYRSPPHEKREAEKIGSEYTSPTNKILPEIQAYMTQGYGWVPKSNTSQQRATGIDIFEWQTLGWSYLGYIRSLPWRIQVTLIWYDHGTLRDHVQREITAPLNSEWIRKQLDDLYISLLEKRESHKNQDLEKINTVEIPKWHLSKIYRHLDQPWVRNGNEILGYWISSTYQINEGVLPLMALANPPLNKQEVTPTSCRLRDDTANFDFNYRMPNRYIASTLPEKEATYILQERNRSLEKEGKILFTGAGCTYNWHKHPSWIEAPSSWDRTEALRDMELQFPNRTSYFYLIAVPLNSEDRRKTNSNQIRLSASEYGGTKDYLLKAYLLVREKRTLKPTRSLSLRIRE